jgi:hypothetical protein
LSIKKARFIATNVELGFFFIKEFVPVHSILLGIIPHGVIPPIEERMRFKEIHRVAIHASLVLEDLSANDIIHGIISLK